MVEASSGGIDDRAQGLGIFAPEETFDEFLNLTPFIDSDLVERRFQFVQNIDVRCLGQAGRGVERIESSFYILDSVEEVENEKIFGALAVFRS